jgi:hypothetical protein
MSGLCKSPKCTRSQSALCKCCQKPLCQFHIDEHYKLLISELQPLVNDINVIDNELKSFDIHKTNVESREKLEQWRIECYQKIDRLFEKKCQELDQCIIKKISKQTDKIDQLRTKISQLTRDQDVTRQDINFLTTIITQMKKEMINIEYTYVQIKTLPLKIDNSLFEITETIRPKIDLSTLSSPCKTINHSDKSCPVLASNNKFLLIHQGTKLCLVNQEMNIVKEVPWSFKNLLDMCWSTTLDQFILINENDLFLVDENITSMVKTPAFSNDRWLSCTCSDTALYLSTNELGSSVNEFTLLPRIEFIKQWPCPFTCQKTEQIDNLIYNNGTLALLINNPSEKSVRIELRFSATLDYLWSLPLDIKCTKKIPFHFCLLNFDEWLVADYEKCHLVHITKFGQIKAMIKYKVAPYHVNLFNHNKLVVLTKNGKNFHQLV